MVWKNLLRRKGRTALTIIGISVGVAAIVALGTMAQGLNQGYGAMLKGSQADLVLSQPDAFDISYSSIDEKIGAQLLNLPEIDDVSGMIQGIIPVEQSPYFFLFGYPEDSFVLPRFQIIRGMSFDNQGAFRQRGDPILIGSSASELLDKDLGDTLRISDSSFRIVGIYETGDAFEDSGAILPLAEAQNVLGKPNQVSIFYMQLKDPDMKDRVQATVSRRWPDLSLSTADDFADRQLLGDMLQGYVWVIAGLAVLIGGVGMTNAQLMAVFERTREIGVLRAVGWSRWQVLQLILKESVLVGMAGGLLGIGLGWGMLLMIGDIVRVFGATPTSLSPVILLQALLTVGILGVLGGIYPAWRASRLQPLEALRYEGGTASETVRRLPIGGMALQSLWQRTGRTLLTLSAIGLTVGAIMALEGVLDGTAQSMTQMATGTGSEIMLRQADVADTSLSAVDERVGSQIETLPGVSSVSGMIMTALIDPDSGSFTLLLGYAPHEFAIQRLNVVEGQRINGNHQVMLGRVASQSTNKKVGDTMEIGGSRFRVVGIFESAVSWEDMSSIVSLRDAQIIAGRPNKVTLYSVKLEDPQLAPSLVDQINNRFSEVHAALAGDFVEQMPDMQAGEAMLDGISFLAILVGGVGVLNTMLMAVLERTREIGVLRTMGWRRRKVLGLILNESLLLGIMGGVAGILLAFLMVFSLQHAPLVGDALDVNWTLASFVRAFMVSLLLGIIGGLYPALRASGMQPVEALRYE
jgi:ABC-type antimicrobial peptide transport system permease subunit